MASGKSGRRLLAAASSRFIRSRACLALVSALAVCWLAGPTLAASPARGTTGRLAREDALRSLPLARLSPEKRAKVQALVSDGSVFRRMPACLIQCDAEFYTFLLNHPEVVVNIWSALGVSEVRLKRTGPDTFDANDGAGTSGHMEYLYRSPDTYLLYGEGIYAGSMFSKPVRGQCLLLLKTGYVRDPAGRSTIVCRLDAFMHLDHVGVEILARTFQPLIGPVADHNFHETVAFVESLNRAAELNYVGVQELAKKLDKISDETRRELNALTEQVAIRAALADVRQPAEHQARPLDTARRPTRPPAPQSR